jgi:serine protease AprX
MKAGTLLILLLSGSLSATDLRGPVVHMPARKQSPVVMKESTAYPNPFENNTTIFYNPSASGKVAIRLYTGSGQLVGELFNDLVVTGQYYQFELNGSELNPGVYYYTIESRNGIFHQRLELVR